MDARDAMPNDPVRCIEPLLHGFRSCGGIVNGDAFAAMLRDRCDQAISVLARRIVRREMVHVPWRSQLLVPLFQFEPLDLSVREGVCTVMQTLAPIYDDWEMASWFAEPNESLGGRRPAELVVQDPDAVIQAARADWFVVQGF